MLPGAEGAPSGFDWLLGDVGLLPCLPWPELLADGGLAEESTSMPVKAVAEPFKREGLCEVLLLAPSMLDMLASAALSRRAFPLHPDTISTSASAQSESGMTIMLE